MPLDDPKQTIFDVLRFALITLVIVIPVRAYVAQPFIVSGVSMVPTFENGEYLIIDEMSYHFREPERGEVVVFRYPKDPSKFYIKRVIGLPGETITISPTAINIKTTANQDITLTEPYLGADISYTAETISLGADEYFVLGDNRNASSDSRIWGPVADKFIKGRVGLRLFPLKTASILPGDFSSSNQ
ncbi:MAG: signal peptidase I [Candidatus Vogelbacteria bacterium RIFOXYD1_FULL_44_32]|uniref:Signal peptidase I n=1 Tax=Candidatus Vogelbacteria bacterium RIFOXYD1_FULL_44_32 TaxID=1802438 RepID=A0A1G2QEM7_9BACT|nr:MAG: signal peptidase I [Candidatus Vogelbacteria bacterium RIFOXYD1_FULL_44_32]